MKTSNRNKTFKPAFAAALMGLIAILSGCGGDESADLREYVKEVKSRPGSRIDPLPEIKEYPSYTYNDTGLRNPFEPTTKKKAAAARADGVRPDPNRNKEILEQFPLDSLRMMGVISKEGQLWALIKAVDGTLYRARRGEHIGHDNGRIVQITENQITINEIIADGLGGWIPRESVLKVSE